MGNLEASMLKCHAAAACYGSGVRKELGFQGRASQQRSMLS